MRNSAGLPVAMFMGQVQRRTYIPYAPQGAAQKPGIFPWYFAISQSVLFLRFVFYKKFNSAIMGF